MPTIQYNLACVSVDVASHASALSGKYYYIQSTDYYISGGGKPEMARDDEDESRVLGLGNVWPTAAAAASRYMPTSIALLSPPPPA